MREKKIKTYKLLLILIGMIGAVLFAGVVAQQPATEKPQDAKPETNTETQTTKQEPRAAKEGDLYWAGQNVEVGSEGVKGDVAVAGSNVNINGEVQGYVMAAGATVNIDAPVGNDLWAAGANIVVNSTVSDNAMLAGSSVIIGKNGSIGGNARIAAGTVEIAGPVGRGLSVSAGEVRISSNIEGSTEIYTDTLTIEPNAVLKGTYIVYSPNDPVISPQANISGKIDHRKTEAEKTYFSAFREWFSDWFLRFASFAVLGLVAVWFSSVWTNRVANTLKDKPGKSFLIGLATLLSIPILFILLLITLIGIPLAFLVAALGVVAFLLSGVFVSYLSGDWILGKMGRWEKSNVLKIVFGALAVTFVMSLPWIGWLVKFAVAFLGVGAFLIERKDLLRQLREQELA
ncbi:MAG: polymer-forming cytoskeletal protein [Pyrinomonadaceae bacterium]|nr:polymer-forming cytoskeletal protein [Pyrinomonadaceae bacterium]